MGLPGMFNKRREDKDESEMEDEIIKSIDEKSCSENSTMILTRRVHSDAPEGGA
jgi:hypothetical protein